MAERDIVIHGSRAGLGIRVAGPAAPDSSYGVYVKSVTEGSLANTDGQLRAGDKLLSVGEFVLTGMTQRQAIDILKQQAQTDCMNFTVDRSQEAYEEFNNLMAYTQNELSSTSASSIVGPVPGEEAEERGEDPPPQVPEKEAVCDVSTPQTITIAKTSSLGIVPRGGEDNEEGPQVTIAEVTEGGDAFIDGRLAVGDVLLSINNHTFHSITLIKVLQLLTRMKISRRTKEYVITFQRQSPHFETDPLPESEMPEMVIAPESAEKRSDSEEHASDGGLDTKRSSKPRNSDSKQKHGKGKKKGIQRKISLDPHCKVKLSKLEKALDYLGYTPTEEQRSELHSKIEIDEDGYVVYLDFVNEAKKLFAIQIDERQFSSGLFFLGSDGKGDEQDQDLSSLQKDSDLELEPEMFEEVTDTDGQKENDLLEEIALLNKKLDVAEARNSLFQSKQSENEKTIRRLVAELQQQRNQTPAPKPDEDQAKLSRKLATLNCENRKLECNIMRYEVVVEKLLQFCQLAHENLSEASEEKAFVNHPRGMGESARMGSTVLGNPRPPPPLAGHARHSNITLAQEAQETVAAVRKMISQDSVLPRGWDEAYTEDGLKFYINYELQTTTWLHPITKTGHSKFHRQGPISSPFTQPPKL